MTKDIKDIKIPILSCNQCGHTWVPTVPRPKVCPACKSYRYGEPKRVKGAAKEPLAATS